MLYAFKCTPKNLFLAPKGYVFTGLDYSGQELMIAAVVSKDPTMLKAFLEPEFLPHPITQQSCPNPAADLHTVTTQSAVFPHLFKDKEWYEWVQIAKNARVPNFPDAPRQYGKKTNFSAIYLCNEKTISVNLGIPEELAANILKGHRKTYSTYYEWAEQQGLIGEACGWISTPWLKRVRAVHEANAKGGGSAKLLAPNVCIQGTGADISKTAMVRVYKWKEKYCKDVDFMSVPIIQAGQVHDELVPIVRGDCKLNLDKSKWEERDNIRYVSKAYWDVSKEAYELANTIRQIMIDTETEAFDGVLVGRVDEPRPSPWWCK